MGALSAQADRNEEGWRVSVTIDNGGGPPASANDLEVPPLRRFGRNRDTAGHTNLRLAGLLGLV